MIKKPIDLSIIGGKIEQQSYANAWEYLEDMHLMFDNALLYNKAGSFHHRYAQTMKEWWVPRASSFITEELGNFMFCLLF